MPKATLSNFRISLVGLGLMVLFARYLDAIIMSMASSNEGTTSSASSKSCGCSYDSSSEQMELEEDALFDRFRGCHMLPSFQFVKSFMEVCAIKSLKSVMLELFALLAYMDVSCGDWRG